MTDTGKECKCTKAEEIEEIRDKVNDMHILLCNGGQGFGLLNRHKKLEERTGTIERRVSWIMGVGAAVTFIAGIAIGWLRP